MSDAWFSSSLKIMVPSPPSAPTTPTFARYPDPNSSADSVPFSPASDSSSRRCTVIVPLISRDAPAPTPQRMAASAAASRARG